MEIKDRIEQFIANWCPSGNDPEVLADFESELLELLEEVYEKGFLAGWYEHRDRLPGDEDVVKAWSDFLTNIEQDGK